MPTACCNHEIREAGKVVRQNEINGQHGENTWSSEGDQWIIKTNAILPDGKKLAATNIVTRSGPDTITWQLKDRTLNGKALPDTAETNKKRVPSNSTNNL